MSDRLLPALVSIVGGAPAVGSIRQSVCIQPALADMGFADRLATRMVDKAGKAVTEAAIDVKGTLKARSGEAGPRLLELLRMDNDRPITIETLTVLLVDAVRKDDEARELCEKSVLKAAKRRYRRLGTVSLPAGPVGGHLVNLYCEAATLCDLVELRREPLSDEEVASHLLVLWHAMPDAAGAMAAIEGSGPSVLATLVGRAEDSFKARLPERMTKKAVVMTLWSLRGVVSEAGDLSGPGIRGNLFPGERVKEFIAEACAQLDASGSCAQAERE